MTVADAKSGQVVETLIFGIAGGNVYKVDHIDAGSGRVHAWKNFRGGKIMLHPTITCREIPDDEIKMMDYRF